MSNVGIKYEGSVHNKKGYLKAYSDGSKIAAASGYTSTFEVFDFNDTTGVLSNPIRLASSNYEAYGVEFSPDGTKLYATVNSRSMYVDNAIWQYDISSGVQNTIRDSRRTIATQSHEFFNNYQYGALQLGPNGKIYVARHNSSYLGVINNPNSSGSACNYNNSGVNLAGRTSVWGLPFFIQSYFYNKSFVDIPDLTIKIGTKNVRVPIYANLNCGNTDTLLVSCEMSVKFDMSIFYFRGVENCNLKSQNLSENKFMTVFLSKDSIQLTSEPIIIGELIGDILLGWDSDTTSFNIENFVWLNNTVEVDSSNGILTTYGVCQSDLRRIINIGKEAMLIKPNPINDYFELIVKTGGIGQYNLAIYDELGDRVWNQSWISEIYGGEEMILTPDISEYPQGTYFAVFSTPFEVFTEKIIMIK